MTSEKRSRMRVLYVAPEMLASMLSAPGRYFEVIEHTLPRDAEVIGADFDIRRRAFALAICSMEYEPVPAGQEAPECETPVIREGCRPSEVSDGS